MEMKVNSKLVRALRNKKLWSQDELATACGVSLRTIQRLEGEGKASAETTKALAAVFELDVDALLRPESNTSNYLNVQLGVPIIALSIIVVLMLVWVLRTGEISQHIFLVGLVIITTLSGIFSTLTTMVDATHIKWHFSLGILKKSQPLCEVIASKPVRNKAWWGIGIRLIPNGWLYCVSGLDAVALQLPDGREIRIGTDEPEALNQAIKDAQAAQGYLN